MRNKSPDSKALARGEAGPMLRKQSPRNVGKSFTPLWDAYYEKAQNRKFKNKWEKIKNLTA